MEVAGIGHSGIYPESGWLILTHPIRTTFPEWGQQRSLPRAREASFIELSNYAFKVENPSARVSSKRHASTIKTDTDPGY